MITSNWVLSDLLRSFADRTARGGVVGFPPDPPKIHESLLAMLSLAVGAHGGRVHDFRTFARGGRGAAKGSRPIEKTTAICWHQSAAVLGKPERYMGVPCHAAVMRNGDVVLLHPVTAITWHGHAANAFSIGVEVDCRAAGTEGDRRTFWRSRREKAAGKSYEELVREPTDIQLQAAVALGVYLTEEVHRIGGKIVAQMFHRNSHSSRTSDPGSRIALNVALPLAERYGHEYGGPVVGTGNPIPESWK